MGRNVFRLVVVLTLFGFYYISFLVELGFSSQLVIFVRGFSLFFVILSFFKFRFSLNKYSFLFVLFLIFYFTKLFSDTYNASFDFGKSANEIRLFAIGVTFIPTIAFLNKNLKRELLKMGHVLYFGFNILPILMLIFNTSSLRLSGNSLLNPITAGHIAASSSLINILVISESRVKNSRRVILSTIFLLTSLTALAFASSRGPILGLLVCLSVYFLALRNLSIKVVLVLLALVLILVPILFGLAEKSGFIFMSRMTIDYTSGASFEGEARVLLWNDAIHLFLKNPIFGGSTTTVNGYVHNFYLELLMSTGIVGLFIYALPFSKALINTKEHLKNDNVFVKWIGLLFFQYAIGSVFSGTIYSNYMFWLFFALMLSGTGQLYRNKRWN